MSTPVVVALEVLYISRALTSKELELDPKVGGIESSPRIVLDIAF